jgi:hypothetical protein
MISKEVAAGRSDVMNRMIDWLTREYKCFLITTVTQWNGDVWHRLEGGTIPYGDKVIDVKCHEIVPKVLAFQIVDEN